MNSNENIKNSVAAVVIFKPTGKARVKNDVLKCSSIEITNVIV